MSIVRSLTSKANPTVKHLHGLATSSRDRRAAGQTVLDGVHLIQAAQLADWPLKELVVSESGLRQAEIGELLARLVDVPRIEMPDNVFRHISPVDTPSGVLAVVDIPGSSSIPSLAGSAAMPDQSVLVLDRIQDSGNLGTLLRTAAAVGIGHVWLTEGCAQAWSPRVLRAGMGGHFCLSIHEQLTAQCVIDLLGGYRGEIAATVLSDSATGLYELDLRGPVAWLFGAEGQGLSPALAATATRHVMIPMPGAVESLNVASAAAVCLFEQLRQQRMPPR